MDWDRIRATDLMMMFNSFLPPKSIIHSVIVSHCIFCLVYCDRSKSY